MSDFDKFGLIPFQYLSKPIELIDVAIQCNVRALAFNVITTFTYHNPNEEAADAKFVFPLDDVAVYSFEAQIDGRVIVAECRPREEAQTVYKEAVAKDYGAILVEQGEQSEDVFQMSIGKIPAEGTAKITLKYTGYLLAANTTDEDNCTYKSQATFLLPSVINPRYSPPESKIKPEYDPFALPSQVNSTPYAISFEANVKMPHEISDALLVADEYTTQIDTTDKRQAKVTLKSRTTFDHDLRLVIRMNEPLRSFAVLEPGDVSKSSILSMDCIMAQFLPDFSKFSSQQESRTEFVFVIDRSGSMAGAGIESASASLLLLLKSLPLGCRFQIIGFGNSHEALFPEPVEYNDRTLAQALRYQKSLEANMGGTNVLPALQAAYDAPLTGHGWYRQILFVTDGYVSNANEVIGLVGSNVHKAKIFPIGVRLDSGKHLLASIARAGRGMAAFIQEDSKLRGVLMRILEAALKPRASEIKVQWDLTTKNSEGVSAPVDVLTIPELIPVAFHGQFITAYGLIPAGNSLGLSGSVTLHSEVLGEKQTFTVELSDVVKEKGLSESSTEEMPLHRLAGKCQLNELGDRYKTEQMSEKPADDAELLKLRGTIEKISCAINILSPVTAMVGVDPVKREPVLKQTAAQEFDYGEDVMDCSLQSAYSSTANFGLVQESSASLVQQCSAKMASGPRFGFLSKKRSLGSAKKPFAALFGSSSTRFGFATTDSSSAPTSSTPTWLQLAELQCAGGCWDMNASLAKVLELPLKKLRSLQPASWPSPATTKLTDTVWATALALAYLKLRATDDANEWGLLANKAKSWLNNQAREFENDPAVVNQLCDQLLALAEKAIKTDP